MRTFILSLASLVAIASTASAQPLPTELWAGGVIVKVDTAARTVDVRQGTSDLTYSLAAEAEVKDGKKTIAAADLAGALGQQVKVKYVANGTTRTASKVTLHGVPKSGSAAAVSAAVKAPAPATTPE